MQRRHSAILKKIKNMLPRRESERRSHRLAKHTDILTCIETRLSMLSMTYAKYMDLDLCCFIPGRVIDEVNTILQILEDTKKDPLRTHEVLQELRDISSMAIEHFDEKISNILKKSFFTIYSKGHHRERNNFTYGIASSITKNIGERVNRLPSPVPRPPQPEEREIIAANGHLVCLESKNNRILIMRMERRYKAALKNLNEMTKSMKTLNRYRNFTVHMKEMSKQIVDLKKRIEEADAKNREISANLNQIETETRNHKPSRSATTILKRRINSETSKRSDERRRRRNDE